VVAELSTHGERACGKGGFGGFGHITVSDLVSGKCGERDCSGERNGQVMGNKRIPGRIACCLKSK